MVTRGKLFQPTTLIVPVGSTVSFPNQDEILHNVFSPTPGQAFDLGLMGEGESAERVFRQPGVVMVFCNVHFGMYAAVVAVDTPFSARVDADGRFRLTGLPAGGGTLHVWHPRIEPWSQRVAIPAADGPLAIDLRLSRPLIPEHRRIDGGSYAPER